MKRTSAVFLLCLVVALSLSGAPGRAQGFSTETVELDAFEADDDGAAGPVSTTQNLEAGVEYKIVIDGTFSVWGDPEWSGPNTCGTPAPGPEHPSPNGDTGPVSHDAEFLLAEADWGGTDCSLPLPREDPLVRIDVGSGPQRLEPVGGVPADPADDHQYTYRVTGQGQPARFELIEDPTSDNYGVLHITVEPAAGRSTPQLLTPRGCVDDNDSGPEECAVAADGLDRPRSIAVSPDGRSVYAVSELDHAIIHFDRDTSTGTLTPRGCIEDSGSGPDSCSRNADGLTSAIEVAISPDGRSVYTASLNDHAIAHFSRNTTTGALTSRGCVEDNDSGPGDCADSTDGLQYTNTVVVSPDGRNVYAGGQNDDAIVVFDRAEDGDLTPTGCIDDNDTGADTCAQATDGLDGARSMALSADGTSLYVAAFADDDAITHFQRDGSTGALTPVGCIDDNDTGNDECRRSTNGLGNAHSVSVSPDGRSVYATGADHAVVRFDRDTGSGSLTPRGCVDDNDSGADGCGQTTDGMSGAASVGISPDGSLVLVVSTEPDHALVAFNRNSSGEITPAGCVDDNDAGSDECAQSTDGLQQGIWLAFSPDGRFVYTVGYDDDAIAVFEIDGSGRPKRCSDRDAICGGSGNEELQGTPEDEFIFAGSGNDEIDGGGGNDVIVGGDGRDVIVGGPGKDKVTGGAGKDRIVGDGGSSLDPSAQDAWVYAAQAASSADQLSGGGGNDTVLGQAGNDKLTGDAGNDTLKGGGGVNNFNGGAGKDLCVLENKKDKTQSCERKKLNFKLNFWP